MAVNLTPNAIAMICRGEFSAEEFSPIVQVVDLRLITSSGPTESKRYRMVISDGLHTQQGMLATQKNDLVHSGQLQIGSIVQLSQFVGQIVINRKIVIIIDLEVIREKCQQIGDPKQYEQAPPGPIPQPRSPTDPSGITKVECQSNGGASSSSVPSPGQNVNGRALLDLTRKAINLTDNAIAMLCSGEFQGDELKPIVQVADLRLMTSGTSAATERYRVVISDGLHTQQGMLDTQKNELVHSGQLQKGSIVQLSQFICPQFHNGTIIIIIDLIVIVEKCLQVGDPKQYEQAPK